jgi:MerR family transcriptional regulator, copper efflux regulator
MRISELAHRTGVSVHALRHYERLGLIAPVRSPGSYRQYTEAQRREVVFIAMSRHIGFSLKAIAERLPAYRNGRLTFNDMVEAMQSRIAEIDAQVMALHSQRKQAVEHIAWLQDQARKQEAAAQAPKTAKAPWPTARKTKPATPRKTP